VAPDREKSASSLALSLRRPLRVQKIKADIYAVDGTPADCIYLALKKFLPRTPDIIISGINPGPNVGQQDISYSGTVSAAIQGTFFEVPAMAISAIADRDGNFHYREATRFVLKTAIRVLIGGLPPGVTLNINIPPPPVKGAKITAVGQKKYIPEIIEKKDPRENSYYWLGRGSPTLVGGETTDVRATHQGFISITPLHTDMTDYQALKLPAIKRLASSALSQKNV
jgi:5'-nucleotidase